MAQPHGKRAVCRTAHALALRAHKKNAFDGQALPPGKETTVEPFVGGLARQQECV